MDDDNALIDYLGKLAENGMRFNKTDVWIMLQTQANRKTISQLAELRGLTYQAIHSSVRNLAKLGILTDIKIGNESYWKCSINLRDLEDPTVRVNFKKQNLNFEELVWFLNFNIVESYVKSIRQALGHVYWRALQQSEGDKPAAPTSWETKSLMEQFLKEIQEYVILLKQIIDLPIYQDQPAVIEMLRSTFKFNSTDEALRYMQFEFNKSITEDYFKTRSKRMKDPKSLAKEAAEFEAE